MAFQPTTFSDLTGLSYDKSDNLFWGVHGGYQVFLTFIPSRNALIFFLMGKLPPEADAAAAGAYLQSWYTARSGITALTHQRNRLSCVISLASRGSEPAAAAQLEELTALAAELQLIPCCSCCGAEGMHTPYLLDGSGETVCGSCRSVVEYKLSEAQTEAEQARPNTAGILIGAITGGIAVLVFTLLGLRLSRISVLTAFAGLLIGYLVMQKLGKKLTLGAAALCSTLCLIAGCAAAWIHFPTEMAENNQENKQTAMELLAAKAELEDELAALNEEYSMFGEEIKLEDLELDIDWTEYKEKCELAETILAHQTVDSCRRDYRELTKLEHYEAFKSDLPYSIAWTVISVLAGSVVIGRPLLKVSSGKRSFKELY